MTDSPSHGITDPRPRLQRIVAFTIERFLPAPQVVLLSLLWAAGMGWAVATARHGGTAESMLPAHPHWLDLAFGYVGTLLFFFHLRVFDDVKDADHDRLHETSRPIPRGLVSERECDALSVAVLAVELVLFAAIGQLALATWAIAAAFTVLMRVEFFVGAWLDSRVMTYAISHMLSMGLLFAMLVGLGNEALVTRHATSVTDASDLFASAALWIAYGAAFCLGMGFELGRKFERYDAAHGSVAWQLWMLFPSVGTIVFAWQARDLYPMWVSATVGVVGLATIVAGQLVVARRPAPGTDLADSVRSRIEMVPALAGLITFLVLAIGGSTLVRW